MILGQARNKVSAWTDMSRRKKRNATKTPPLPDESASPPAAGRNKRLLLVAILAFAAWIAFLVTLALAT